MFRNSHTASEAHPLTTTTSVVPTTRRPKACKLATNPGLRLVVEDKLAGWWSPQQISGWLRETHPSDPEMWVSHETIYLSLFVQGRGALRHELTACLRTRRAIRRPKTKQKPSGNVGGMSSALNTGPL